MLGEGARVSLGVSTRNRISEWQGRGHLEFCEPEWPQTWLILVGTPESEDLHFSYSGQHTVLSGVLILLIGWLETGILLKHEVIVPWWLVNRACSHMLIDHLDFLFCELPVRWPCLFFNSLICLSVNICMASYILWTLLKIPFFQFLTCLFNFFIMFENFV